MSVQGNHCNCLISITYNDILDVLERKLEVTEHHVGRLEKTKNNEYLFPKGEEYYVIV